MEQFAIRSWESVHDEGTKFYKVFLIESENCASAYVVTHWGAYQPGDSLFPAITGQCKVKAVSRAEGHWEACRARDAKRKRGYRFLDVATEEAFDAHVFRVMLDSRFKAKDRDVIRGIFNDSGVSSRSELAPAWAAAIVEPPVVKEKLPEWGSW